MENVSSSARSSSMSAAGLTRTVVDINSGVDQIDVSDRLRKFKMENGKSAPNLHGKTKTHSYEASQKKEEKKRKLSKERIGKNICLSARLQLSVAINN